MQCPVDGETLVITDRSGVEIDYCPKCRGVWLDRGELDKLIDRAGSGTSEPTRQRESNGYRDQHQSHPHKKKKGSFLGELFDF
jgi:uncharacterized protein